MLFPALLLTPFLLQGPAKPSPKKDTALLPPSCFLYLKSSGIPKTVWPPLLHWVEAQLGSKSPWISFFPPKSRRGLPIIRSILRGLPRNGLYQRMVDLLARPFSMGGLRDAQGRIGFFEIFRTSSPRMARYTARKLVGGFFKKTTLGDRILLSADQWVLDQLQSAWGQYLQTGKTSARAKTIQQKIEEALPGTHGLCGFADLAALNLPRSNGTKVLEPFPYLLFGSWEELLTRSPGLSFGFTEEGGRLRGTVRFSKVVEEMDEETKAVLAVGKPPRFGAGVPQDSLVTMSFDRKIPAFLASFGSMFPKPFFRDLQEFFQQLELFFRGQKAEKLLSALEGPFRIMDQVPFDKAPFLRLSGQKVQLLSLSFEGTWKDAKTRKRIPPALQVFVLGVNQQRKNNGKRPFLLHQKGNAGRGILRAALKALSPKGGRMFEDLFNPSFAWDGGRVGFSLGAARLQEILRQLPKGERFHEFWTLDGPNVLEALERLGPLPLAAFLMNGRFPPTETEALFDLGKKALRALGRMSLGLRWEKQDALLVLDWQLGVGLGGAR